MIAYLVQERFSKNLKDKEIESAIVQLQEQ